MLAAVAVWVVVITQLVAVAVALMAAQTTAAQTLAVGVVAVAVLIVVLVAQALSLLVLIGRRHLPLDRQQSPHLGAKPFTSLRVQARSHSEATHGSFCST
jgi:hypothetical protein